MAFRCIHCYYDEDEEQPDFPNVKELNDHYAYRHPRCTDMCNNCFNKFRTSAKRLHHVHMCFGIVAEEHDEIVKEEDAEINGDPFSDNPKYKIHEISKADAMAKNKAMKWIKLNQQSNNSRNNSRRLPPVSLMKPCTGTSEVRARLMAIDLDRRVSFDFANHTEFPCLQMPVAGRRRFAAGRESAISRSYASFIRNFSPYNRAYVSDSSSAYSAGGGVPLSRSYAARASVPAYSVSGNAYSGRGRGYVPFSAEFIQNYGSSASARRCRANASFSPSYSAFIRNYARSALARRSRVGSVSSSSGHSGLPCISGHGGSALASGRRDSSSAYSAGGGVPLSRSYAARASVPAYSVSGNAYSGRGRGYVPFSAEFIQNYGSSASARRCRANASFSPSYSAFIRNYARSALARRSRVGSVSSSSGHSGLPCISGHGGSALASGRRDSSSAYSAGGGVPLSRSYAARASVPAYSVSGNAYSGRGRGYVPFSAEFIQNYGSSASARRCRANASFSPSYSAFIRNYARSALARRSRVGSVSSSSGHSGLPCISGHGGSTLASGRRDSVSSSRHSGYSCISGGGGSALASGRGGSASSSSHGNSASSSGRGSSTSSSGRGGSASSSGHGGGNSSASPSGRYYGRY